MQAHLSALHGEMWEVITNRPVKIWTVNPASVLNPDVPRYLEKLYHEWTNTRNSLDNIANDIFFKVVDETILPMIDKLESGMEIWDVHFSDR